jgi:integrase
MVQYTKLMIYRERVCLYYASGDGNSYRYNFGISVKDFNTKELSKLKNSLKKNLLPEELSTYKREITELMEYTNNEISYFKSTNGRKPTIEELKQIIQSKSSHIKKEDELNLIDYLNQFINEKRDKFNITNTISSLKDFISFRNSILDFQLSLGYELFVELLNYEMIKKYFNFIHSERDKNLTYITRGKLDGKTIKKRFDTLKQFYNWCLLNKRLEVQNTIKDISTFLKEYPLSKITKDVKKQSLTTQQVIEIINFPTSELPTSELKAREMFLVVLHTGMRISDLITLKKEHIFCIDGVYIIKRKSIKTRKEYEVELDDYIYEIIRKNDFNMRLMSEQKGNIHIKKFLSRIPEFHKETIYETPDSNPKRKYKLYEIITFHQGRRTFITNLLDSGEYSIVEVMTRTDHTKISTLEKYVSPKSKNKRTMLNLYKNK